MQRGGSRNNGRRARFTKLLWECADIGSIGTPSFTTRHARIALIGTTRKVLPDSSKMLPSIEGRMPAEHGAVQFGSIQSASLWALSVPGRLWRAKLRLSGQWEISMLRNKSRRTAGSYVRLRAGFLAGLQAWGRALIHFRGALAFKVEGQGVQPLAHYSSPVRVCRKFGS